MLAMPSAASGKLYAHPDRKHFTRANNNSVHGKKRRRDQHHSGGAQTKCAKIGRSEARRPRSEAGGGDVALLGSISSQRGALRPFAHAGAGSPLTQAATGVGCSAMALTQRSIASFAGGIGASRKVTTNRSP